MLGVDPPQMIYAALSASLVIVAITDWTIDDHLLDKPADAVAMYHRLIELIERCGPFTYAVSKTTITLKGTHRGFVGARPTVRGQFAGYLDLQRDVRDSRVISVSRYTARLYVHQFRISTVHQLDDGFGALLCEAYQVGAGAHGPR